MADYDYVEIEKSIPKPCVNNLDRDAKKLKLHRMDCGDSIFIKGQTSQDVAAKLAYSYGYKTGKRFSSRTTDGGVRIWRVK